MNCQFTGFCCAKLQMYGWAYLAFLAAALACPANASDSGKGLAHEPFRHPRRCESLDGRYASLEKATLRNGGGSLAGSADDRLLPFCRQRYPIHTINRLYFIEAKLCGPGVERCSCLTFLLDTGWTGMAITDQAREKAGLDEETAAADAALTAGPGDIILASERLPIRNFQIENASILRDLGVDGVFGSGFFLLKPILLNLVRNYICFPTEQLSDIADRLDFIRVPAEYDAGRIWVGFSIGGRRITDYFIDTGSNVTSLLGEDVDALGLDYHSIKRHHTVYGEQLSLTYGPVAIGWGGRRHELRAVYLTEDAAYRKIGTDILSGFVIGIDPLAGQLYTSGEGIP